MNHQDGKGYRSIWSYLATVPHRQDWITTGDFRTRYVEAGTRGKPALIMIHGTGGSWEAFCANLGPLSQHFHCFALDMIGCGYTEKPDRPYEISEHVAQLVHFMQAQQIERASFMGISMGSWIAARFALAHPEKTDKLVLLSAFGLSNDQEEIGAIIARRGKAFEEPTWEGVKEIFGRLMFSEEDRIDDFIGLRLQTYSQPAMKAAGHRVLAVFKPEFLGRNLVTPEEWQAIAAPALVVASVDDKPLYANTAKAVAGLIPDATLIEMKRVGHWPQFENSKEINEAVAGFLKG